MGGVRACCPDVPATWSFVVCQGSAASCNGYTEICNLGCCIRSGKRNLRAKWLVSCMESTFSLCKLFSIKASHRCFHLTISFNATFCTVLPSDEESRSSDREIYV